MNSPFNQNPNSGAMGAPISIPMAADASTEARLSFIRMVYVMFTASVLLAVVGGIFSLNTPLGGLVMAFAPWSLLLILPLSIGAQVMADKPGLGTPALFGFAALLGIIIAPVVNLYSPNTVTQAGALTVLIFGALTAYVFVTRKDFNFLGGIVFVGLIACIGAGLLNLFFFKNSGFSYWDRVGRLDVFGGLCALRHLEHHAALSAQSTGGRGARPVDFVLQYFHVALAHSQRTRLIV